MRILCATALLLVSCWLAQGQNLVPTNPPANVTLAWNASPTTTNGPISYILYYGPASTTYTNTVLAGTNLTCTASNLVRGATYYFAVTATATNGLESVFSNEVSTNTAAPPPPPTVLRIIAR